MRRFFLLTFACAGVEPRATPAASNLSDEFYSAIRNNDLATAGEPDPGGADVNTRDRHAETPLMYAAYVGSLDAMKLLLKDGASIDAQSQSGATALIWSATDLAKVRLLIDHGANVNLATKRRRTALLVAAMSDSFGGHRKAADRKRRRSESDGLSQDYFPARGHARQRY